MGEDRELNQISVLKHSFSDTKEVHPGEPKKQSAIIFSLSEISLLTKYKN